MQPQFNILIIDDDTSLSMLICDMLEDEGYGVYHVTTIEDAYAYLMDHKTHLILLDINLPDGTGFEFCEGLRTRSDVPIIFASARTSEDDKVIGLDLGADDYLAKPYSIKELSSRIRSLLRRTYKNLSAGDDIFIRYDGGKIAIQHSMRRVLKNEKEMELSPKEYDLLYYFATHRNQSLTKEQLINEVWGAFSEVEQSTLTVHVRWLREKFERNPSKPTLFTTVWGIGYMLKES